MNLKLEEMRFCVDPADDAIVRDQMKIILEEIIRGDLSPRAIVVGGSFGRGEGVLNENKVPVNDYDIVLILSARVPIFHSKLLRRNQKKLEALLNMKHLDLMAISVKELGIYPPNMFRYDLKKGHSILWGDPNILATIPEDAPKPFPQEEIRNLLINRLVTFLEAHPDAVPGRDKTQRSRQLSKVILALADSILFEGNRYATKYGEKFSRIKLVDLDNELSAFLKGQAELLERDFFSTKEIVPEVELLARWAECRPLFIKEVIRVSQSIDQIPYNSPVDLFPNWRGLDSFSRLFNNIVASIRRRPSKWATEQKMLSLIQDYKEDPSWKERAQELVTRWYE